MKYQTKSSLVHSFLNRSETGGWTVKTENQGENLFFKYKELDFFVNSMNC